MSRSVAVAVDACHSHRILVFGDFNTWSEAWGTRHTNLWSRALEIWAKRLGLVIQNQGAMTKFVTASGMFNCGIQRNFRAEKKGCGTCK